jgi:hypothetical protein
MSKTTPTSTAVEADTRDRLLLALTELGMYGIETAAGVPTTAGRARAELAMRLAERAPHGLGSYVFWRHADEGRLAGELPLHTSGPEVDRAVVAACAHHGLAVRPGRRPGVLLVRSAG